MRQDLLAWIFAFSLLDLWAGLLFWPHWWQRGCWQRHFQSSLCLEILPGSHELSYFTRGLVLRRLDDERLLWRQRAWQWLLGGWHGQVRCRREGLLISRRLGLAPLLVWPLLLLLPHGLPLLLALLFAAWRQRVYADRQLHALLEFLRRPLYEG